MTGPAKSTRRCFLAHAVTLAASSSLSVQVLHASGEVIEIDWSDLAPDHGGTEMERLRSLGIVQHGEMNTPFDQEKGGVVTDEFNGRTVKIPGYLVPLDLDGMAMKAGLLVPYVGACIHVPPPPPNQLIFVTADTPYESEGLFEPVWVTGRFGTTATETMLAEVGYSLSAELIEPFRF